MKRFGILVIGFNLSNSDCATIGSTIKKSLDLRHYNGEYDVSYESVVSKRESLYLSNKHPDHNQDEFGYIVILGQKAYDIVKHQLDGKKVGQIPEVRDWAMFKSQLGAGLGPVLDSYVKYEIENEVAEATKAEGTKLDWVQSNLNSFEQAIRLALMNNRSQAVIFNNISGTDSEVVLRDATKRLRVPIEEVVPVIIAEDQLENQDNVKSMLVSQGYKKPYLITVDNFMVYLKLICMSKQNKSVHILVEATDEAS